MSFITKTTDLRFGYTNLNLYIITGNLNCKDLNKLEKLLDVEYGRVDLFHQLTRVKECKYGNKSVYEFYDKQNFSSQEKRYLYNLLTATFDIVNHDLYYFLTDKCRNNINGQIKCINSLDINAVEIDINNLINDENMNDFLVKDNVSKRPNDSIKDVLFNPDINDLKHYQIYKIIDNLYVDCKILIIDIIKLNKTKLVDINNNNEATNNIKFYMDETLNECRNKIFKIDEQLSDIVSHDNYQFINLSEVDITNINNKIKEIGNLLINISDVINNIKIFLANIQNKNK